MKQTIRIYSLALVSMACGPTIVAEEPQRIKVATVLPRGTSTHQVLLEMTAKWRAAGLTSTLYTDGVMGGEAETVRRMRIGQIQGALLSVAGLSEIDRSVTVLQYMPLVFRSLDEVAYVRDQLRPMLEKRLEEKGFVLLCLSDAGWVQLFSKRPVLHPDDLTGQKVFVLTGDNSQSDLVKAAGYKTVSLEYTDILSGLQTGMVDAVPTAPFYALAGQFYLPAQYMTELNYAPLVGGLVVTRKAWESLSPPAREAARRAASDAGKAISTQSHREMQEAVAAMQKRGLRVTHLTPSAEAEWHALFAKLYPNIRGTMVPADLFDEVQGMLREYRK